MNELSLKALYFIRKRQLIQAIEENKSKSNYYEGFLYAIKNDIYPIFMHENEDTCWNEVDLYDDCYSINKELIKSVLTKVDDFYCKKDYKSFYEWEDFIKEASRYELIKIFKYCKLEKKFNNDFWSTLIDHKNNPDEAEIIIED